MQLKPLQFVRSEIKVQEAQWDAKGTALLTAKRYDEIERIAHDLQHSNAHSAKGTPFLRYFFDGLCSNKDGTPTPQTALSAWKAARPKSNLARIVAIQCWTKTAWRIRGGGYANTITPAMSQDMNDALGYAYSGIKTLPKAAFDSPLAFDVAQSWGQLSGAPRAALDDIFKEGARRFPNYQPLFRMRAILLMPRWFGEPGELEAYVTHRADALGAKGDIFYARMIWTHMDYYKDVWKETAFSYDRFKRGMIAICKEEPNSVSTPNALMTIAWNHDDTTTVQAFFASPRGYLIDEWWWNAAQKITLSASRMDYLAK